MKPIQKNNKILVINQVALNLGDAAILWGTIEILKRKYGAEAEIIVFDAAADIAQKYRPWATFRTSLFFRSGPLDRFLARKGYAHWNGRLTFIRLLVAMKLLNCSCSFFAKLLTSKNELIDLHHYTTADVIVSAGGTYLIENYDLVSRILEFRFAIITGKPLVLITQSLGPFNKQSNKVAFKKIFSAANLILLRDNKSKKHIIDLGLSPQNIHIAGDTAFVLAKKSNGVKAVPIRQLTLAVSVRSMANFNPHATKSDMIEYNEGIVLAVRTAVEKFGAKVIFLSTCQGIPEYWTNDAEIADEIFSMLPKDIQGSVEVDRGFYQPWDLIDALEQFDAVIATRMHAAILSICAGIPTFGIAYEFKTKELFEKIGMSNLVLNVDDFTVENIENGVCELLSDLSKHRSAIKVAADKMHTEAWKAEYLLPDI